MELSSALAAAAALVSLAATMAIFEQLATRRQEGHQRDGDLHLVHWCISLFLFTAAAACLWAGASFGWSENLFRAFYLLGGILNVLFLGLGSIYLATSLKTAHRIQHGTLLFGVFSIGVLWAAPARPIEDSETLPRGSEVFEALPRILVALASSLGAAVVFGVALLSIWKYLRNKKGFIMGRLWGAVLVALGTLVLSVGGLFNSVADEMQVFATTILVGVSAIFAGFLVSVSVSSGQGQKAESKRQSV